MKNLYKVAFIALGLFSAQFSMINAEQSCVLCDNVRADVAANHQNYEYYEDYLKAQGGGSPQKSVKGKLSENIRANRKNRLKNNAVNDTNAGKPVEAPAEAPVEAPIEAPAESKE